MLGSLSELFGRNFAIAHVLPATAFAGFSLFLADRSGVIEIRELFSFYERFPLLAAVVGPLLIWLGAVSLLAANFQIIRAKEGYPLQGLQEAWASRRRSRRSVSPRTNGSRELRPGWQILKKLLRRLTPAGQRDRRAALLHQIRSCSPESAKKGSLQTRLVTHFPPRNDLLLPTSFGNVVRAFECYPRQMYGFEAVQGWPRLLLVMTREQREAVEGAKAEVDFLVNLWFLSWLFLLEYLCLGVLGKWQSPWFALAAGVSLLVASQKSLGAAARWGEMVKACFDVLLPELRRQLGFKPPENHEQEGKMWEAYSMAFLHRQQKWLGTIALEVAPSSPLLPKDVAVEGAGPRLQEVA